MAGVSRWGVWPAARDDLEPGARDRRGDGLGAGATVGSRAPAMTSVAASTAASRSWSGSMAPWPGTAQAGGEPCRPVPSRSARSRARAGRRETGQAREDRFALPFVDEGLDPGPFETLGAGVVGGPRAALGRVGDAGRWAFQDEAPDRRADARPRTAARHGPERVAEHVRRRPPHAIQDRREVVGGPLHPARPDREGCPTDRGRAGRRRRPGTGGRTSRRALPSSTRGP